MATLDSLPDELARQILLSVPAKETLCNVQFVSKHLYDLAGDQLLWRQYCQQDFLFWSQKHEIRNKWTQPATEVDWRSLWTYRTRRNLHAARMLSDAVASKVGRMTKLGEMCQFGYDVKDFLLQQCRLDPHHEDNLARKYHAKRALASIHRSAAIEEWAGLGESHGPLVVLDRVLAGFDMFFMSDMSRDIDEICSRLDVLIEQFLADEPRIRNRSVRVQALTLVGWVRQKKLTGMDSEETNYRRLSNCLLGYALADPNHASLPIISSAIYCCLATRIGLQAACCALPGHVRVVVTAPNGLDGGSREEPAEAEQMYLDPYVSADEIDAEALRLSIEEHATLGSIQLWLQPATLPTIVSRLSGNMTMTLHAWMQSHDSSLMWLSDEVDVRVTMRILSYCGIWSRIFMLDPAAASWNELCGLLMQHVTHYFPEDAWIVEKYLMAVYQESVRNSRSTAPQFGWENVKFVLSSMRNIDQRILSVSRRYTEDIKRQVWYKIGQVFRHKRYGSIGIICGWNPPGAALPARSAEDIPDAESASDDETADAADDYQRSGRRSRVYYTCLYAVDCDTDPNGPSCELMLGRRCDSTHVSVTDQDAVRAGDQIATVDQDHMIIVKDASLIDKSLMDRAGKYFKRFDDQTCTFVSNVRESFPDD